MVEGTEGKNVHYFGSEITMRCKQDDLAIILKSVSGANTGKIVTVAEYIGFIQQNEFFEYRGVGYRVPITDNYWWVTTPRDKSGFDTHEGETSKGYIADLWLQPIRPDLLKDDPEAKYLDLGTTRTIDA